MIERLLFAVLLGAAGFREMFRQYKALVRIKASGARHRFDHWGHVCALSFGFGVVQIGAGQFWSPLAMLGWFVAGTAAISAMPVPCGFAVVNDWRSLKIIRNAFFLAMGCAFIAHSLSLI